MTSVLRIRAISATGLILFFGPVALLAEAKNDFKDGGGIPCIFNTLTGFPCPGCGTTRAFATLSQLDVIESVRFHPIAVVTLAVTVFALLFTRAFLRLNSIINLKMQDLSLQQSVYLGFGLFGFAVMLDVLRVTTGFFPG